MRQVVAATQEGLVTCEGEEQSGTGGGADMGLQASPLQLVQRAQQVLLED